jgi:hypothetical protein
MGSRSEFSAGRVTHFSGIEAIPLKFPHVNYSERWKRIIKILYYGPLKLDMIK